MNFARLTRNVNDMRQQSGNRRRLIATVAIGVLLYGGNLRNAQAQDSSEELQAQASKLLEERKRLDQTVWKDEVLAQEYEQVFVNLWDELRAAEDKLKVLEGLGFSQLRLGQPKERQRKDLDVHMTTFSKPVKTLEHTDWIGLLAGSRQAGIEIVQTEWHHAAFDPADAKAVRSTVNMEAHLLNGRTNTRTIIKGPLQVVWEPRSKADELPRIRTIDAMGVTMLTRQGEPAFRRAYAIQPNAKSKGKEPLLFPFHVYDLNKDGLSEIIIPSLNTVRVNKGGWQFDSFSLFKYPIRGRTLVGVFADFTGDGWADFLCAGAGPLALFVADGTGRFSLPPRQAAANTVGFDNASVFTAGDVDGDGDLDVWIGQYKQAYTQGQMPTPFYDANDGFADYLLQNDGKGNFVDITETVGLGKKRFRRTYGGSLVDLDDDLDLDLVVCADFAGLDAYLNDGKGRFTDVSDALVDQRHSFGMALSFADYNLDGKIDIFMTGMGSTTARRLERMKLNRDDFPMHKEKRMPMGYGNRMYLAGDEGGTERRFPQASFNDQVARTGWSWGTSSFDFDNDGDRDIYVANGFLSQGSVKDYCTHYWRQDIYMGNSLPNPVLVELQKCIPTMSWNAYEHNSLLMNEAGSGFVNIAFLMGVAFEFDSRSVVSDDLDGDGRMDLIVYRHSIGSEYPFEIYALENRLESDRHWIGLRLNAGPGRSVMGATVVLRSETGEQVAKVVSGDSYYCQHAPLVHFGLGSQTSVKSIDVIWLDGSRQKLDAPAIDRYHVMSAGK